MFILFWENYIPVHLLIIFWHSGISYDKSEKRKHFNFRPKIVSFEGATCEEIETCFLYKGFLICGICIENSCFAILGTYVAYLIESLQGWHMATLVTQRGSHCLHVLITSYGPLFHQTRTSWWDINRIQVKRMSNFWQTVYTVQALYIKMLRTIKDL